MTAVKFDAEDMRQLVSLGRFASSAYQAVASLDAFEQQCEELRENHAELAQTLADLQKANLTAQDSHCAAINLMEQSAPGDGAAQRGVARERGTLPRDD